MKRYNNIHEAYLGTLADVYNNPEFMCSPRGMAIREKMNYQVMILNPKSESIITKDTERNSVIDRYTKNEMKWYLSGSRDVEDAVKISKFWGQLANPDGTINSNYGHLVLQDESEGWPVMEPNPDCLRTPFEWAKISLLRDKDTRQAIMRFNKPKHCYVGNKDFVCTMYSNFHIRDNKLNFTVRMRSSDLHFGVVYDWPFFIRLQETMLNELKDSYEDLSIGTFTFSSDSLHIYERSFKIVEKMMGK